jgi:uncharacterized membrane-anchored protein
MVRSMLRAHRHGTAVVLVGSTGAALTLLGLRLGVPVPVAASMLAVALAAALGAWWRSRARGTTVYWVAVALACGLGVAAGGLVAATLERGSYAHAAIAFASLGGAAFVLRQRRTLGDAPAFWLACILASATGTSIATFLDQIGAGRPPVPAAVVLALTGSGLALRHRVRAQDLTP